MLPGLGPSQLALPLLVEQGLARSLCFHQARELAFDPGGDVVAPFDDRGQSGLEWELLGEEPMPRDLARLSPLGLRRQLVVPFGSEGPRLAGVLLRLLHGGR